MNIYLAAVLRRIPQILSQIDHEPFSPTYGCGDRVYWCWKFTDFPGSRFQEHLYTLSWLYSSSSFDNRFKGNRGILSLIEAGLEYWASIQYADGSFDEAYPFERSFAATAFTMFYSSEGFELVRDSLDENVQRKYLAALEKAAGWLCRNDEHHGTLSNHLAAAAAALYNAGILLKNPAFTARAEFFLNRIYSRQSSEGWYREYDGADVGYQTHGSFYLARIWQKSGDAALLESLRKANAFASYFVHPDGSVGGEYASRDTMFYYPAAYEMLYGHCSAAAAIADHQRENITGGKTVGLEQMDAQNLFPVANNYLFAFENMVRRSGNYPHSILPVNAEVEKLFPEAGLFVKSTDSYYAVVGCRKGGVIKAWDKKSSKPVFRSCGYVVQAGNRWFSNQAQGLSTFARNDAVVEIAAPFSAVASTVFSPWKFIAFRIFTLTAGRIPAVSRWLKDVLVSVLIRKKKMLGLLLKRKISFFPSKIILEDRLEGGDYDVRHIDKFTAFHMGSSRYIHMEEEIARGAPDGCVTIEFGKNGVLKNGVVTFPCK